jgi:hypothetical protein
VNDCTVVFAAGVVVLAAVSLEDETVFGFFVVVVLKAGIGAE